MIRSLALAVSLALGTVSIPAHALGLGDIKSRSALNQNFDADIDLLSVVTGEIDALRVRLATQDAFQRAGVERPFYLSLLKFKPTRLDDGTAAIRITSDFPIREPFLNFLVEVNWPKGRLVREYTVLLDPPTTTKKRAPKVTTASTEVAVSKARKATVSKPTPIAIATTPQAVIDEYGPVKANETLWGIAKRVRPNKGIGIEQMMIALQQANPQAFINNNINRLREGQILRVPDTDEIREISRVKARTAFREQQDEWLAARSESMQQKVDKQKVDSAIAQNLASDSESSSIKVEDQLKIAAARPEGTGDAGASEDDGASVTVDDLQGKLLLARENAETSRLESEALRDQMGDLQKRLEDMQRLLTLKDNQLAQLQDNVTQGVTEQAFDGASKSPFADEPLDPIAAAMQEAQASFDESQTEFESQSDGVTSKPVIDIDNELISAADAVAQDVSNSLAKKVVPVTQVTPEPVVVPPVVPEVEQKDQVQEVMDSAIAKPDEEVTDSQVEEPSAADTTDDFVPTTPSKKGNFFSDNLMYLLGGSGLLILLILLLLGRKKSSNKQEADEKVEDVSDESILLDDADDDLSIDEGAGVASENDTSFLSEFSPSDINALQDETGEVDPVSEADVYIAYGRYQQSEELLTQALEKDPGRLALKHKLLEVYYATRNKQNFVSLAQNMVDGGQDIVDEEAWLRVKGMGRELDSENVLFAGGENESRDISALTLNTTPSEPVAEVVDEDSLTLDDLELSALASDLNSDMGDEQNVKLSDDEADLSLDLDDLTEELDSAVDEDSIPIEGLESLELELPELDSEELESELNKASTDEQNSVLDDDSILTAEDLQAQLDELSDLSMLDDEISDMVADEPEALDSLDTSLEIPKGDDALDQPMSLDNAFDLDLEETIENVHMDALIPEENIDADAVTTKLDLAKAYVEMGDQDGAKSILEEVKAEGNDAQKSEADSLLDSMS